MTSKKKKSHMNLKVYIHDILDEFAEQALSEENITFGELCIVINESVSEWKDSRIKDPDFNEALK